MWWCHRVSRWLTGIKPLCVQDEAETRVISVVAAVCRYSDPTALPEKHLACFQLWKNLNQTHTHTLSYRWVLLIQRVVRHNSWCLELGLGLFSLLVSYFWQDECTKVAYVKKMIYGFMGGGGGYGCVVMTVICDNEVNVFSGRVYYYCKIMSAEWLWTWRDLSWVCFSDVHKGRE